MMDGNGGYNPTETEAKTRRPLTEYVADNYDRLSQTGLKGVDLPRIFGINTEGMTREEAISALDQVFEARKFTDEDETIKSLKANYGLKNIFAYNDKRKGKIVFNEKLLEPETSEVKRRHVFAHEVSHTLADIMFKQRANSEFGAREEIESLLSKLEKMGTESPAQISTYYLELHKTAQNDTSWKYKLGEEAMAETLSQFITTYSSESPNDTDGKRFMRMMKKKMGQYSKKSAERPDLKVSNDDEKDIIDCLDSGQEANSCLENNQKLLAHYEIWQSVKKLLDNEQLLAVPEFDLSDIDDYDDDLMRVETSELGEAYEKGNMGTSNSKNDLFSFVKGMFNLFGSDKS